MHGIVFRSLKQFVTESHGNDAWTAVRADAGVGSKLYLPVTTYDDGELFELVESAAAVTHEPTDVLLEGLGVTIAEQLLDAYGNLVDGEWTALDLIEHTEEHIHTVLRTHNPELSPPELACRRLDEGRVAVRYRSDRGLCAVAKGIARGVGDHYDEDVSVDEPQCMHDGAGYCELVVTT